jgi:hypothetical protein
MRTLKSATEIVDALGGNVVVAQITSTTPKAVSNWRAADKFPSNTYVVLRNALALHKIVAPTALWSMRRPATKTREKRRA